MEDKLLPQQNRLLGAMQQVLNPPQRLRTPLLRRLCHMREACTSPHRPEAAITLGTTADAAAHVAGPARQGCRTAVHCRQSGCGRWGSVAGDMADWVVGSVRAPPPIGGATEGPNAPAVPRHTVPPFSTAQYRMPQQTREACEARKERGVGGV